MAIKYIRFICITFIVLFTLSCTSGYYGACRHRAIYAAYIMQEKYPSRIVVFQEDGIESHAQCKAFIDNEWQWISMVGEEVYIGHRESKGKILVEYQPIDFVRWMEYYKVYESLTTRK